MKITDEVSICLFLIGIMMEKRILRTVLSGTTFIRMFKKTAADPKAAARPQNSGSYFLLFFLFADCIRHYPETEVILCPKMKKSAEFTFG